MPKWAFLSLSGWFVVPEGHSDTYRAQSMKRCVVLCTEPWTRLGEDASAHHFRQERSR
jgi:hypothetical protein